jgi:hypothetical protein
VVTALEAIDEILQEEGNVTLLQVVAPAQLLATSAETSRD